MADVLHRTTLEHRRSVNTPDYDPKDWLVNPDLSAVKNVPRQYWTVDGDRVIEMDAAGKAAVDSAELEAYRQEKLLVLASEIGERLARKTAAYATVQTAVAAARTREEVDAVSVPDLPDNPFSTNEVVR